VSFRRPRASSPNPTRSLNSVVSHQGLATTIGVRSGIRREIRRSITEKACKKYYGNQGRHVSQGKGTADGNQTQARKQFTHIHTRQPSTSKTEEPSSDLGERIEPSSPANIEGSAVPVAERQHWQIRIEQPPRDRPVNDYMRISIL